MAVAHIWHGTLEDTAQIRSVPAPDSFRRQLEAGGCTTFSLVNESLVTWHLAFGDEASTAAALSYLEQHFTRRRSIRTDLAEAVARAVARPGRKADAASLPALVAEAGNYRFLAMEFARAADFFRSPILLEQARAYAAPALGVQQFARTQRAAAAKCAKGDTGCTERAVPPALAILDNYIDRQATELDLQLAVAGVRVGGSAADFAAARAVFERNEDPGFELAREHAYQHGNDFCDIGDRDDLREWRETCRDDNLEGRAITYWRYRALYTLAAQASGNKGLDRLHDEWDGETALRLIEGRARAETDGVGRWGWHGDAFAVTDIRLAMAEVQLAKARARFAADPRPGRTQAAYDTVYALDRMWLAARYALGPDHPGWLRRIGMRYMETSAWLDTIRDKADPPQPDHARRLAWLQTMMPRLDAVARGEASPPP